MQLKNQSTSWLPGLAAQSAVREGFGQPDPTLWDAKIVVSRSVWAQLRKGSREANNHIDHIFSFLAL